MSSARKGLRRAGVGSLSALLAATAMTGLASTASATTNATFTRVQGQSPNADRYGTAVETAKLFGASTDVVLASGEPGHTVDALAASVLAGNKNAPILLTKQAATPQVVLDQIKASGASNIWIVGGEAAVSTAQEQALRTAGYAVSRLSGNDRWGTAADIINHSNKSTTALIATGLDFPDALGGGALSFAAGLPIGLVKRDTVPADTLSALQNAGVKDVIILGGEGVVSPTVVSQLAAAGITVKARMNGANRAETSTMLADYEIANYGFTNTQANIASGYAFGDGADALGGAAFSGEKLTPLLITKNATQAPELATWLTAHAKTVAGGYVFGGPGAVSSDLVASLQAAARNVSSNQTLVVTPGSAATLTIAADATDHRTYTASGLDDTKTYTVALFDASNVTVSDKGVVTFADTDKNDQADGYGDTSVASIVSVNSAPTGPTGATTLKSVNGTVNFTIDGTAPGSVVPVLFIDAGTANQVDLDAQDQPTEQFGVGGETTYLASEQAGGAFAKTAISSVDKDANFFVLGTGGAARTVNYDSNDTYKIGGVPSTFAAFEAQLSSGDSVAGTYAPDADATSSFDLTNGNPVVTATAATADAGTVVTDDDSNDVTVTVTGTTVGTGNYDSVVIERSSAASSSRTWTTVATVARTADADKDLADADFNYIDRDVAAGTYVYRTALVNDGDQGDFSPESTPAVTTTTPVVDKSHPSIADLRIASNVGNPFVLEAGDTFTLAATEVLDTPDLGDAFRVTDSDGTVLDLVNGQNGVTITANGTTVNIGGVDYAAGQVLTVTVGTGTPATAGTLAGLNVPATITTQSGTTDVAGNALLVTGDTSIDAE